MTEFTELTNFNTTIGWLWLVMVMGVANPRIHDLIQKFPDIRELYFAMQDPDNGFLKKKEYQKVKEIPVSRAHQIAEFCAGRNFSILTWNSPDYPVHLRMIYNPPVILFYKGSVELLRRTEILTVVGTRAPSDYSIYVGERLCYEIAQQDVIIASGGAMGLDSVAHYAAIRAGKPTIAVMGCGLDCDYPKGNRELREKILEEGILITEYFPGTPAYGRNFPIRNRILAGIGKGVFLLEASEKSGAMITANSACEQG
ncbi:MAG: DNA-protecting protein DprA, partial [Oscillospiraceae bacterium]|nr:DNA-protecting protein DprA [Oscillospiraceae bacterium]